MIALLTEHWPVLVIVAMLAWLLRNGYLKMQLEASEQRTRENWERFIEGVREARSL